MASTWGFALRSGPSGALSLGHGTFLPDASRVLIRLRRRKAPIESPPLRHRLLGLWMGSLLI